MKKSVSRFLEALLWVVTGVFLPLISLVAWILRMLDLKKKQEVKRGYMWWAFGIVTALWLPVIIFFSVILGSMIFCPEEEGWAPSVHRDSIESSEYGSADGLYRLTGVKFPEVGEVDSFFYQDGGLPARWWRMHKFAISQNDVGLLHERLERACIADSTHWSVLYEPGSYQRQEEDRVTRTNSGSADRVYWYMIYPDSTSVDRSRGMCDRGYVSEDGTFHHDIDGTFISVEVQRDTVWIREGWLR